MNYHHCENGCCAQQVGVDQAAALVSGHGLLSRRDNLDPVSVRILDKVNPHVRILKADATHFPMSGMGRATVVCVKGQVVLLFAQIVGLGAIPQPGQLQGKITDAVP